AIFTIPTNSPKNDFTLKVPTMEGIHLLYLEINKIFSLSCQPICNSAVQRYAPEIEKRLRWYWRNPTDLSSWHIDETYVKVNGRCSYLYPAVDQRGDTIDFYLCSRRNTKSAYCLLGKILNNVKKWQIPQVINTDKAPTYGRALSRLNREGKCPPDLEHRQIKYKNNVIECDHGKLKRIIRATLGFKSMKTAYATIKGIEVMRALRKGQ